MAEIHGKNLGHQIGLSGTLIEQRTYTKSVGLNVDVDVADTTAAGDTSKTALEGVYGWTMDADYNWTGDSGQADHQIFRQIGSSYQRVQIIPGSTTASSNMPRYQGNAFVKSFSLTCPADGVVSCKASWQGTGALNRYLSGTNEC